MISRRSTLLLLALPLRGDERSDIVEWLGKFAGYLTDENSEGFLRTCEKSLRGRLETNIRALVRTYEIASSITVISVAGDGERREVELDWFLELQSRASSTATLRRRERLKLTIERAKKNWTVLDIGATTLFDPAQ